MYQAIGVSALLKGYWYLAAACAATLATNAWANSNSSPRTSERNRWIGDSHFSHHRTNRPNAYFSMAVQTHPLGLVSAIEGTYDVEMASNWSLIEARANGTTPIEFDANTNAFRKVGKMTIKARLLDVHVHLVMDDGYAQSDTIACSVKPAADGGPPHLYYVYRAHVPVPKSTDSESHYGAARIPLPNEKRLNELTGTYWTDRNWHKGLNTAGRLILKKV